MKIAIFLLLMIGFTVIANLLLKTGATTGISGESSWTHLLNWRVAMGFLSYSVAAFCYAAILQYLPLNVAQSFTAAQFLAVIFAAFFVLSEPISAGQWVGVAMITCGIVVVGWSAPPGGL